MFGLILIWCGGFLCGVAFGSWLTNRLTSFSNAQTENGDASSKGKAKSMKTLLTIVLFAALAKADSIPLTYSGINCFGSLTASYLCNATSKTGRATIDLIHLTPPNHPLENILSIPAYSGNGIAGNSMQATIMTSVFNSGIVNGTFSGDEFLVGANHGIYEYAVTGTYSINGFLNIASIHITSSVPMGRVATTPEPGTWYLMLTGLSGIGALTRKWRA